MIKTLELFSGYGGSAFALKQAKIEHKIIGYSDIEKCANYIFSLNHGDNIPQLNDIKKINVEKLEDFDLLTAGFPCQSFSLAGKREGFDDVNKGKLFFEIIRIAKIKNPRWMLLENVEGILSHDDGNTMKVVLRTLYKIGYHVHWKKLYSKKLGTPQNRPRVWFACFKNKEDANKFLFPENIKLTKTVKDLLELKPDEKYNLTDEQLHKFNNRRRYGDHKLNYGDKIHPTLCSIGKSDVAIIPEDFKIVDFRYDEGIRQRKDCICPTLTSTNSSTGLSGVPFIKNKTWRRLTPRECFRLMGFFDDEIEFGTLSDAKLYFLAGNGWDINVASKIFTQMFKGNILNKQKSIFDF